MSNFFITYLWWGAAGGAAAFLAGHLGIGGGVILVPFFYFVLQGRYSSEILGHVAVATSLFVIVVNSFAAFVTHLYHKNVDMRRGLQIAAGGLAGVVLGVNLNVHSGASVVMKLFGFFEIAVAVYMFSRRAGVFEEGGGGTDTLFRNLLVGFAAGVISSYFGVGGGVVAVPLQVFFLRAGIHSAVGTSSFIVFINAVVGTGGYIWKGWVDFRAGIAVAAFSLFFSVAGARLAAISRAVWLRRFFALLLFVLGLLMVFRAG